MRILVVGAGAVGGYFGGRLIEAGRDVTFLVRAARAERLRRDGLRIVSPHGDAALEPRLVVSGGIDGPYDVVLLGVKSFALSAAMDDVAPAVGPGTIVFPVLNGLRHMDELDDRFGRDAVIGGVAYCATDLDGEGRIVQLAEMQRLAYGERDGRDTPRIRRFDAGLSGAGFDAAVAPDIVQAMWEKWTMLASLGAITCLLRGSVGSVAAVAGGADIARAVLAECAAVAAACGHRPSEAFLVRQGEMLTAAGSPMTSSMFRDLAKGAPVEAETILGDLVARGRARDVPTPLVAAAAVNLRVYEAGRSGPDAGP